MNHIKNQCKISICIPTYNYGKYLKKTLESLTQEEFFENCEIVIGDGGSNDGTKNLATHYGKSHNNIHYYNFGKKSGIDIDLKKTADFCAGEYIWFLSADDMPTKGSIKKILGDISTRPACILYDRILCDYFLNVIKVSRWSSIETPRTLSFSDPKQFASYLDTLFSLGGLFSFMSVIVIRRDIWENVEFGDVPIAKNYQHVVRILRALNTPGNTLFVPAYYLINFRGDNDSFLENGAFRRLLIDYRGYRSIFKMYKKEEIITKFKQVMRQEHKWYYIPKFLANIERRNRKLAIGYLLFFGFNRFQILTVLVISSSLSFVKFLRFIRRFALRR
ncbi:glycosyltransferase family 2 protein [Paracoccaceae bacterium]|nr:glycosyltransferase family 2 protein [Paracoccaceae bacterium]